MLEEADLMDFYGEECVPCKVIEKHLERLKQEEGIQVARYEVWHNSANQTMYMKYAEGKCRSVPFLYNKKTGKFICGEADYEAVKAWAKGE